MKPPKNKQTKQKQKQKKPIVMKKMEAQFELNVAGLFARTSGGDDRAAVGERSTQTGSDDDPLRINSGSSTKQELMHEKLLAG
jgi:hypothetical protein